jgi:hypothetical protein
MGPGKWRAIAQEKPDRRLIDVSLSSAGCRPKPAGRHAIPVLKGIIESAEAGEPACVSDFDYPQRRVSEKLFGEQQPPGRPQLDR